MFVGIKDTCQHITSALQLLTYLLTYLDIAHNILLPYLRKQSAQLKSKKK